MPAQRKRRWAEWEVVLLNRFLDGLNDQVDAAIESYANRRDSMDAAGRKAAVDWWDQVRRVLRWAKSQLQ